MLPRWCRFHPNDGGKPGEFRARATLVALGIAVLVWLLGGGCTGISPECELRCRSAGLRAQNFGCSYSCQCERGADGGAR